jgi:hypothetical protein
MGRLRLFVGLAAGAALVVLLLLGRHGAATATDRATTGELVRCEEATRSLALAAENGEVDFVVAADALIHEGTKTVAMADVCASIGQRIKIWYRQSGNTRTVHDIRMSLRATASRRGVARTRMTSAGQHWRRDDAVVRFDEHRVRARRHALRVAHAPDASS